MCIAIGLLIYAGALVAVARAPLVGRRALMAFTFADGVWVVASALVLLLFWTELTPLARILVIAAAIVVDVFAMLQFRAAGGSAGGSLRLLDDNFQHPRSPDGPSGSPWELGVGSWSLTASLPRWSDSLSVSPTVRPSPGCPT